MTRVTPTHVCTAACLAFAVAPRRPHLRVFFPLRPSSFRGHSYCGFHDGAAASFFSGDTWADSTEGFVVDDPHGLNPVTTTDGLDTATAEICATIFSAKNFKFLNDQHILFRLWCNLRFSGQCEEASNASCAGTPFHCSAPPLNVVGQFGLMLLTFITTHVFQFRFADAEHYRHPSWLITLTFLHETVVTLPQTAALVITLCLFVHGGFSQYVCPLVRTEHAFFFDSVNCGRFYTQWTFRQLWKKYGMEHLSPTRLQQCVHEEKHQHMAVTMEAARVRPFKTKVIVSWLPLATFSRT